MLTVLKGWEEAIKKAKAFSATGRVIAEEYITGTEMSIYGYIEESKAKLDIAVDD